MKLTDVIRRPLITEKTSILREDGRTIVFEVATGANKIEIKRAVEKLLGSKVDERPHEHRARQDQAAGPVRRARSDWKKAYVKLREGEKMPEFLEGRVIMPIRKLQPDVARHAVSDGADVRRDHDARAAQAAGRAAAQSGGRNNHGELTSWWRGGGHKRMYRIIDFKRDKHDIPAKVVDDRVRPEPLGADRAADLRRRREALHPAADRPEGRRHDRRRARTSTSCRATRCR